MKARRFGVVWAYAATMVVIASVWELYVTEFHISKFILPSPVHVYHSAIGLIANGQLIPTVLQTLTILFTGYIVGGLGGFALAIVLFRHLRVQEVLADILIFVQTSPKIALAPLFILWFGLGFMSKLMLVISLVFFPVTISTLVGLRSIEGEYRNLARLLHLSPHREMQHVLVPMALPAIFDGLKVGLVQANIGAIVAEWMSGNSGLGYLMEWGDTTFHTGVLLCAIVVTILLGLALNASLVLCEVWLLGWHQSQRRVEGGV